MGVPGLHEAVEFGFSLFGIFATVGVITNSILFFKEILCL